MSGNGNECNAREDNAVGVVECVDTVECVDSVECVHTVEETNCVQGKR